MSEVKIKQIENLREELDDKAQISSVVLKSNHLSDVNQVQARANLSVYSKTEIDSLFVGAKDAFAVQNQIELLALTGLKLTDRIFVENDGDSKWALYLVVDVNEGVPSLRKIADEDLFTNALTASAIKSAYESNADTFAFNGVSKDKLEKISVTANVNLDTLKSTAENASTASATAQQTANNALSASATAQTTANGKEDSFTETTELFTNLSASLGADISVTLANTPRTGFSMDVFFNGVRLSVHAISVRTVTFSVPYNTETSDAIHVRYCY